MQTQPPIPVLHGDPTNGVIRRAISDFRGEPKKHGERREGQWRWEMGDTGLEPVTSRV